MRRSAASNMKLAALPARLRSLLVAWPSRSETAFLIRFSQIRLVVGGDGLAMAPDAIERLCADQTLRLNLTDFTEVYPERDPALPASGGGVPP